MQTVAVYSSRLFDGKYYMLLPVPRNVLPAAPADQGQGESVYFDCFLHRFDYQKKVGRMHSTNLELSNSTEGPCKQLSFIFMIHLLAS